MDRDRLKEIIKGYQDRRQALLPCLHFIQGKEGCIEEEMMTFLAEELGVPRVEIYGVVSFYSMFSLKPQGKYVIRVCASLSCYLEGSNSILETLKEFLDIKPAQTTPDGKFTIEEVSCFGLCDKAPAMMINDREYGNSTSDKVKEIIERGIIHGIQQSRRFLAFACPAGTFSRRRLIRFVGKTRQGPVRYPGTFHCPYTFNKQNEKNNPVGSLHPGSVFSCAGSYRTAVRYKN